MTSYKSMYNETDVSATSIETNGFLTEDATITNATITNATITNLTTSFGSINVSNATITNTLTTDTINENTSAHGVIIDGTLIKDNTITISQILDMIDSTNYKITLDSANSRIRFSIGGNYIDFNYNSYATINTPKLIINLLSTAGILHNDSSGNISSSLIINNDVDNSAGIVYSKLNLSNSILNADINASAGISYSKLNLASSVKSGDINSQTSTNGQVLTSNGSGATSWTTLSSSTNASTITLASGSGTLNYIPFSTTATGNSSLLTDTDLTYNASTNVLNTTTTNSNNSYIDGASGISYQYLVMVNNYNNIGVGNYALKAYHDTSTKCVRYSLTTGQLDIGGETKELNGKALYVAGGFNYPDASMYVVLRNDTTDTNSLKQSTGLKWADSTGTLTCTNFSGNATTSTTSTNSTNINLTNSTTNASHYIPFSSTATGNQPLKTNTALNYNPSTTILTTPKLTVGSTVITYDGNPIGSILMFVSITPPASYLNCDGSAISRTTYASLFSIISTTYGSGDGSTTFNIPDMRERMPYGYKDTTNILNTQAGNISRTLTTSELPAHTHGVGTYATNVSGNTTYSYKSTTNTGSASNQTGSSVQMYNANQLNIVNGAMTGSSASSGSGSSFSIMNPYISVNFIIKVL